MNEESSIVQLMKVDSPYNKGPTTRAEQILRELDRMLEIIASVPTVRRVILFGSALSPDKIGESSDIDLCIVEETDLRFYDRLSVWFRRLEPRVGLDLVVYTPAELRHFHEKGGFVEREIISAGREIHVA